MRSFSNALGAALLLCAVPHLSAQTPAPAIPQSQPSPFRRLDLPTAGTIRTGSGAPGRDYWQQRVDYVIHATLDTVSRTLTGYERITYANRSPDTLRYIWIQLEQNTFSSRSRGALLLAEGGRWGTKGADVSVTVSRVARLPADASHRLAAAPVPLSYTVNGTLMRIDLDRPLPPKGSIVLEIAWSFLFGPQENRMGLERIDGHDIYEVAQWYPRPAVYDDVRGWNTEQYYGLGEFYLEYGSFDVSLTVPANMIVASTGSLVNPEAVLTPVQRRRLADARHSGETVVIRGQDEVDDPASHPRGSRGALTWRFTADSVRDFVWAAAVHFVWDAVGANQGRTLVMSYYPPSAEPIWNRASQYGKAALERYSSLLVPFPYATMSNVNGVEGGMEYPRIVFCHNRTDPQGLYGVTSHEFAHTWFPMMVGSNERRYEWMDEGFNTFVNYYDWAAQYPGQPNTTISAASYLALAGSGWEIPIMTATDQIGDRSFNGRSIRGWLEYNKAALGIFLLRERILDPARFDFGFREYIRRWAYKHPTPADFFRTMEDAAGEDLSWFWRGWFYTTGTLDQAVDSVGFLPDSLSGGASLLYLHSAGGLVMPVELALTFDDGTTERRKLPVEIWFFGPTYTLKVRDNRRVTGVTIDPDGAYPDRVRGNNDWTLRIP